MKRHCVGQTFIVYCSKATKLQQKSNLFKLLKGRKGKKKLMNCSFVFKLYFSPASNYVQINYKFLYCISHFLSTSSLVVPCVSSRTHPKKVIQGQGKKACAILKGRAPKKDVFSSAQEKNGGRGQKTEKE